jgi:hypothetical protein
MKVSVFDSGNNLNCVVWLVVAASDGAWICRLIDPACVSSDLVRELAAESRQSLIHSLPVVLFVICDAKVSVPSLKHRSQK